MTLNIIWEDLWKPRQVHRADKYIPGGTLSSKYKLHLKCPKVLFINMETTEWPIKELHCSGEAAAGQAGHLRVPNTALATYTFISSSSWQQCKLHGSNFFFSLLTTCESMGWRFRWRKLLSRCLDQVQAILPAVAACIHMHSWHSGHNVCRKYCWSYWALYVSHVRLQELTCNFTGEAACKEIWTTFKKKYLESDWVNSIDRKVGHSYQHLVVWQPRAWYLWPQYYDLNRCLSFNFWISRRSELMWLISNEGDQVQEQSYISIYMLNGRLNFESSSRTDPASY